MISFCINYYDEPAELIQSVIDSIRGIYPKDTEIFCMSDGVAPFYLHGITYNGPAPQRAKLPENGGFWTHRYLSYMVKNSHGDHFIKIDPDTRVLRVVENLPSTDCIFCRVREVKMGVRLFRIPAGGALGFTRNMARRIVEKGYFLDPRFKNNIVYRNYNDLMLRDIVHWHPYVVMIDRPDFCCGARPLHAKASFYHS